MENFDYFAFIGTYTKGNVVNQGLESRGIYILGYNSKNGELNLLNTALEKDNPSFLSISPDGKYLYSVGEIDDERGGALSAYSIDKKNASISIINSISTGSSGPCHLMTDSSGSILLAANYAGGASTLAKINNDGSLDDDVQVINHQGSSINPERQMEPHAHSINISPSGNYALVPDLGTDKVVIYKIDKVAKKLEPNDPPFVKVTPGMGPRHLEFHPNGKVVYVIHELGAHISVFDFDDQNGNLSEIQTISTLPLNYDQKSCADIHISPDGKYLYGSNRGHDSLAIYKVLEDGRKLENIDFQSTLGKTPRNFAIDPDGNFLLAANQDSNDIFTFNVNKESGMLNPTGFKISIPYPVCIKFLERK